MAKKKTKKSHRRRRHRVGAMALNANSPLVQLGSVALGYLAGTAVNPVINMLIPAGMKTQPMTGKIVAGAQVGLGALLVMGKGKKTLIKTILGGVVAGAGIKRAMIVFAPGTTDTLGGYGQIPVLGAYAVPGQLGWGGKKVAGYGQIPTVGAYAPNSTVNGKVMGTFGDSGSGVTNPSGGAYMG